MLHSILVADNKENEKSCYKLDHQSTPIFCGREMLDRWREAATKYDPSREFSAGGIFMLKERILFSLVKHHCNN